MIEYILISALISAATVLIVCIVIWYKQERSDAIYYREPRKLMDKNKRSTKLRWKE